MIEITEEQERAIGDAMLKKALAALGEYENHEEEETVTKCIKAVLAAKKEKDRQIQLLKKGEQVPIYVDMQPVDVMATAFWVWSNEIDMEYIDVHPQSRSGCILVGFARAVMAMYLANEASVIIDDSTHVSYSDEGASTIKSGCKLLRGKV